MKLLLCLGILPASDAFWIKPKPLSIYSNKWSWITLYTDEIRALYTKPKGTYVSSFPARILPLNADGKIKRYF